MVININSSVKKNVLCLTANARLAVSLTTLPNLRYTADVLIVFNDLLVTFSSSKSSEGEQVFFLTT